METFASIVPFVCSVVLLGASPPSFDTEVAQIVERVQPVIAAYGNPGRSLAGLYASDAVIVDQGLAPFRWSGMDCGDVWLEGLKSKLGVWKMSQYRATSPHLDDVRIDGDDAVVALPVIRSGEVGSRAFRGTVLFTFVLRKIGDTWTITAQSVAVTHPLASGSLQLV